jgi:DNA damage-binding protein 1
VLTISRTIVALEDHSIESTEGPLPVSNSVRRLNKMINNPNTVVMATSSVSPNNASTSGNNNNNQNKKKRYSNLSRSSMENKNEVSHYVVTAHPPGSVTLTCTCNFVSNHSVDILIAKPRRIEVRQLQSHHQQPITTDSSMHNGDEKVRNKDAFPIVLQLNGINGNIVAMEPLRAVPAKYFETTPIFILQERFRYAVIQYNSNMAPYPVVTHASGSLASGSSDPTSSSGSSTTHIHSIAHLVGRIAETAPLVAVDPECRCIVLHLYDGLLTIIPIHKSYVPMASTMKHTKGDYRSSGKQQYHAHQTSSSSMLSEPFHCRVEERTILALSFLQTTYTYVETLTAPPSTSNHVSAAAILPLVCVLHQDSRGTQHITSHAINIRKRQLHLYNSQAVHSQTPWLKKSSVDGGSSLLISVPPHIITSSVATASSSIFPAVAAPTDSLTNSFPIDQHHQKQPSDSSSIANQSLLCGGILILGQRQFTYVSPGNTSSTCKIVPVPQALYLSYESLPDDPVTKSQRYLIGDEFGNLHMLSLLHVMQPTTNGGNSIPRVIALQLETLGSCSISSALSYLGHGLCYVGSALGDSQLIQIHDEPIRSVAIASVLNNTKTVLLTDETAICLDDDYEYSQHHQTSEGGIPDDVLVDLMDTSYISVLEEYTNLGPILDFDLLPTTPGSSLGTSAAVTGNNAKNYSFDAKIPNENLASTSTSAISSWNQNNGRYQYQQSQVVTASGTSRTGTIRVIRVSRYNE